MDIAEIRRRCVGRTVAEIMTFDGPGNFGQGLAASGSSPGSRSAVWVGLILDDGSRIVADGGEDAGGGYGFLEFEDPEMQRMHNAP